MFIYGGVVRDGGNYKEVKGGTREHIERIQGEGIQQREEGSRRGMKSGGRYRYLYIPKYE